MSLTKRILVDLDVLLDTRIATVARLNQQAAVKLLSDSYRDREQDDWTSLTDGLVTTEAFQQAYAQRDVETLKQSRITEIPMILNKLVRDLEKGIVDDPEYDEVVVEVNTYPYQLNAKERVALVNAVMAYAGVQTRVDVVEYTLAEISPSRLKSEWDTVFLYDFDRWFTHHVDELHKVLSPRKTLVVPALYIKPPKDEERQLESFPNMTHFQVMEVACVERFNLEMIRPRSFSIIEV